MADGGQCYGFWLIVAVIAAVTVCRCTSYYFDWQIRKAHEEAMATYYKGHAETMQKYCELMEKNRQMQQEILKLLQR